MVNTSFETLPNDLHMEILVRLPLKSLMAFMCVSKRWAPFIRSKDFRDLYLSRSMTRAQVLFIVHHAVFEDVYETIFQSVNPLSPSGQHHMRTCAAPIGMVSQPVRGLICIQGRGEIVICNPGLKKFLPLPRIQSRGGAHVPCFFGYDQLRDVFKVLYIGDEYQVCTVGSDDQSWRQITCRHDHVPINEGLFIEGVSYYGALSLSNRSQTLMSFNVTSEDFNVIQLPDSIDLYHSSLVNYFGKIALLDKSVFGVDTLHAYLNMTGVFGLWVWEEEAEGMWLRTEIEIPDREWQETTGSQRFSFLGTTGNTILVFGLTSPILPGRPHSLVYYDTVTGNLRRCEVDLVVNEDNKCRTFLNHVDSTWLM